MLLDFIACVFIIASPLLWVGGDGTGEEHYDKDGNGGLDNEGMPPSWSYLSYGLQNWIEFYCFYVHAILILVASVSIDTLPWSACRLFTWHLNRSI